MTKLVRYDGVLGTFEYDPDIFEVKMIEDMESLHYIGKGGPIDLPEGCIDISNMFYECRSLPEGTYLRNFNTSKVVRMIRTFAHGCILPAGFTLGGSFDTSNVEDMEGMFENCIMCDNFSLGNKFYTFRVRNVDYMFNHCSIGNNFLLGNKFDISNVPNKKSVFYGCGLSDEFVIKLLQQLSV